MIMIHQKQMQSLPKPRAHQDRLVRNNMHANEHERLSIQHYTYTQAHKQRFYFAVPHFTVTKTQSIIVYAAVLFMCTVFDS